MQKTFYRHCVDARYPSAGGDMRSVLANALTCAKNPIKKAFFGTLFIAEL